MAESKKKVNLLWGEKLACYIAFAKWKGSSVIAISEAFDITRQQVYLHLQKIPFPNPEAHRFPRPDIGDDDVRTAISHFVSCKDGEASISSVAEKTGLTVADVTMLCNNIRGAHAWYRSDGYPAITEWLNREGVSVDYLEKLCGCTRLASFIFSPFPYREMTLKQLRAISQAIDVPVEELTRVSTAAKNVVDGASSLDDYYTIFDTIREEHDLRPQRRAYTRRSPVCVMTSAQASSVAGEGGGYYEE